MQAPLQPFQQLFLQRCSVALGVLAGLNSVCADPRIFGSHWGKRLSTVIAVFLQATIFGVIHFYYQGAFGALTLFAAASFIGLCDVLFGRNLWPLILSHGLLNTLGFLGDFLGDSAI